MIIKNYDDSLSDDWDQLIDESKNGTFLLKRAFLSYHGNRFHEKSLVVLNKGKLLAVLPLSAHDNRVVSFGGLPYGGLICATQLKLAEVLSVWELCIEFLKEQNWRSIIVKLIPNHYLRSFSDESIYFMFLKNAELQRVDTAFVVDRAFERQYQKRRIRSIRKAKNFGYTIKYDDDFNKYWEEILVPNLRKKHGVDPVHTLEEIELLKSRFKKNIEQVNIYHDDEIVAGTTLFITENVVHAQYISGNETGRKGGFLDALFYELIESYKLSVRYFDFGISNEREGRYLNVGLADWKESYGSNTVAHIFYELRLS